MDMEVKKLGNKTYKKGYTGIILKRDGDIALIEFTSTEDFKTTHYEVHKVKVTKVPFTNEEKYYEKLAGSSEFGNRGFSYGTLSVAMKKYNQLTEQESRIS